MTEENGDPKEETFEPEVETQKIWRMPAPVFRTSAGTKYCPAEIEEDLHETHEQIPSSQAKSSKMPFLLGGAFLLFFLVTALLIGIWYIRNLEVPKVLTPPTEKATPTPTIAPIENPTVPPTETPAPTATPNEIPGATPTEVPTPNPGGAPVNS